METICYSRNLILIDWAAEHSTKSRYEYGLKNEVSGGSTDALNMHIGR